MILKGVKIAVENFMSGLHIPEMAKINHLRMREYAKINLDMSFILSHNRPDGFVEASCSSTANAESSSFINVETVSPDPTSAGGNQEFYFAFVILNFFWLLTLYFYSLINDTEYLVSLSLQQFIFVIG